MPAIGDVGVDGDLLAGGQVVQVEAGDAGETHRAGLRADRPALQCPIGGAGVSAPPGSPCDCLGSAQHVASTWLREAAMSSACPGLPGAMLRVSQRSAAAAAAADRSWRPPRPARRPARPRPGCSAAAHRPGAAGGRAISRQIAQRGRLGVSYASGLGEHPSVRPPGSRRLRPQEDALIAVVERPPARRTRVATLSATCFRRLPAHLQPAQPHPRAAPRRRVRR